MLSSIRLRLDAFEALDLPMSVADGAVGSVRVKVPWRNLGQEPMLIDFTKHVDEVHNLIRGCDSAPGAYFECLGVPITLYGSSVILGTGGFQQRAEALGTIPVDGNVGSSAIVLDGMVVVNCQ